jgi:hypothetical protein
LSSNPQFFKVDIKDEIIFFSCDIDSGRRDLKRRTIMKLSSSWYWFVFCVFLMAGIVGCEDFPTEPAASISDDPPNSVEAPSTSETPSSGTPSSGTPTSGTQPSETEEEVTPGDGSGYCDGSELLCLPAMTSEYVAKYKGSVVGGSFSGGQFSPSSTGESIPALSGFF